MRTLRTTMAAGAAAIFIVSAFGAAAASEVEPCTGIVEFGEEGMTWDASDPRLSGDASGSGGWSFYAPAGEDAGEMAGEDRSYIIVNDDGSWGCAKSAPVAPEPGNTDHTLVFSGTGDYEGLTAHVRIDWSEYPFDFTGVIIEGSVPEDPMLQG